MLNIQKLEEKIELLEEQTAIFPSEQALATSEFLEEIEGLRRQVADLQQEPAHRPSAPAPAIGDLPEPAILLNQLKDKHPKSKVSLKDVEAILKLLEG
ncbi:hypothetical protein [Microcoleus sp. FACHB-672]|uniref:hypothetical protein n=1 Tax=Microcoleus sp. FACHB-672 TaxID=2692825 RepID=UPI001689128E|nr:hypothetical protein [Microcoleus sp. FACHB-672]MBD2039257.1 hypothetical protein [Microcoleus sp. FACHB-672]